MDADTSLAGGRLPNRRIVTGLDANGRSTIVLDGPAPVQMPSPHPGPIFAEMWETDRAPACNAGAADATLLRAATPDLPLLQNGGSRVFLVRYPGSRELADAGIADKGPSPHTSDAVEYIVVLKGEPTLFLETASTTLAPGDFVIFRGVSHDIHNQGESEVLLVAVMIDAVPIEGAHGNG